MCTCRGIELDSYLYISLCPKINSKWIRGLNMKPEALKLEKENISSALQDIDFKKDFMKRTPFTQELRPTIDK